MKTKDSDSLVTVKCSKQSIRRFIKLFLGINNTPYFFHQTLTFKDRITNELLAKSYLKKLLDSLGRSYFDMAVIFIQEYQKNLGIHYHLIFLFFSEQSFTPQKMRESFGKDVFRRWNKLHGDSLFRQANLMTVHKNDFRTIEYLCKGVEPTAERRKRESLWHGIRNRQLIRANSHQVSKQSLKEAYYRLYPKPPKPQPQTEPLPPLYTKSDLKREKDFCNAYGEQTGSGRTWEGAKKLELKTSKKVSDADYIAFRNRTRDAILAKQKPIHSPLQPERKDDGRNDF